MKQTGEPIERPPTPITNSKHTISEETPTSINASSPSKGGTACTHAYPTLGDTRPAAGNQTQSRVEELGEIPIVWYVPNENGDEGYDIPNSPHYTVRTRVENFVNGKHFIGAYKKRMDKLKCKISSMGNGLKKNVVICVAHDTTYGKSMIIDGVKRSLALYYFMVQKPATLINLLSSEHQIYILKYSSSYTHQIFPSDFYKLIVE